MKIDILWIDTNKNKITDIPQLSSYRLQRIGRANAVSGLAGEYLLRLALEHRGILPEGPLEISCGENGKPELENIDLHFNISHSGSITVCAVSQCPVGIDVQEPRKASQSLLSRYFSDSERALLTECEDSERVFAAQWCAKESYVKATGQGIANALSSARLKFMPDGTVFCKGYRIYTYEAGGLPLCCCALTHEECEIEIRECFS